eukprot:sb/3472134/
MSAYLIRGWDPIGVGQLGGDLGMSSTHLGGDLPPQLVDLFHVCEDLENMDDLHMLYDIFKSIFLLNKNNIFEIMFTEELIFDVLGILEYDPALHEPAGHRQFIRDRAQFKQCIPFTNPTLLEKIHQTYRVQFIQADIVTMLQDDEVCHGSKSGSGSGQGVQDLWRSAAAVH